MNSKNKNNNNNNTHNDKRETVFKAAHTHLATRTHRLQAGSLERVVRALEEVGKVQLGKAGQIALETVVDAQLLRDKRAAQIRKININIICKKEKNVELEI